MSDFGAKPSRRKVVGIVISGRFPAAYRTLEAVRETGLAGRLVTSHPRSRLPTYKFPPEWMSCHGWLEYFYRGIERVPGVRRIVPAQWIKLRLLDGLASRELADCGIVNGWSGMSLLLFQQAKHRNALTVLQTGSAHAAAQKRLVEAEMSRHGCTRQATPDAVLRRQLLEYGLADRVVVPSMFVRRTFVAEGVDAEKLVVVPEGVDCAALQPQPKRDHVFRVLFIGHMSFRKGFFYFLESAQMLANQGIEFIARGAADPEFAPLLKRFDGLYRQAKRVPAGKFSDFISQASVVVVPSIEDGWCAVTVEAMACGVPVIVSANTGTADVVREGMDGFVVPAASASAIAERITWMKEHPAERNYMGAAARARALEFSWNAYRARMGTLLSSLQTSVPA